MRTGIAVKLDDTSDCLGVTNRLCRVSSRLNMNMATWGPWSISSDRHIFSAAIKASAKYTC